jgi:catechol 2,3-dioxygenase-like lactoylglutathione lyase family enzyme
MLTGYSLTSLVVYVHDLAGSVAFYEENLGLPLLERCDDFARLNAGGLEIWLEPAADHGVQLYGRRDDSSDVVFLVEDLERMRSALEGRDVRFERRRSYEVGLVTDFYDPNGHRLMLYEPSSTALGWPSGPKIRELWRVHGRGGGTTIGRPAGPPLGADADTGLSGNPLAYLFMFENDQTAALTFYRDTLDLALVERVHCCNQDCAEEIEGIAKYDCGGVLLATHHMHERSMVFDDLGRPYSPRRFDPAHGQGIAPVFQVGGIDQLAAGLASRGVRIEEAQPRPFGSMVRFEDPFGHPFFLLEPHGTRPGPVVSHELATPVR